MKLPELKQLVREILKEELDNLDNNDEMEETDPLEAELDVDLDSDEGEEETEDSYYKADEEDTAPEEAEPTTVAKSASGLGADAEKLAQLVAKKDELVGKLKNKEISMDDYKSMIGNIPQQIKDLQAKIDGQEEMDETLALREAFQKRAGIIKD